jgi:hypothetical protein
VRPTPGLRALALGLLASLVAHPAGGQTIGRHPIAAEDPECCSGPVARAALASAHLVDALGTKDVSASVGRIRLAQGAAAREIEVAAATIGPLLETKTASVDVGALAWSEDGRRKLGGFLGVRLRLVDQITVAADLRRDAIWRPSGAFDPLRGVRVRDLRQLDRGLTATEGRLALLSRGPAAARLDAGTTLYGDGNRRFFLSAGAARSLTTDRELHVALEPAIYLESFARSTPGYLAPSGYAQAAMGVSAVIRRGALAVEASAEPHVYRNARSLAFGVSGDVSARLSVGPSAVELTTSFMLHGSYRFWQIDFRVAGSHGG